MVLYPRAVREPVVDMVGGVAVADPYRWLEGEGAEVEEWLAAQEELCAAQRARWPSHPFFRRVLAEAAGLGGVMTPVTSTPVLRGERRFFLSRGAGRELPAVMVADGTSPPRMLVDPLAFDPSGATVLDAFRPSWSGRLVAFQLSGGGQERPTLRVRDVETGREVGHAVDPGRPTPVAWLADDSGFFYVTGGAADPVRRVRLYRLDTTPGQGADTAPGEDEVVFETPFRQLSVTVSASGRWLSLTCAPGTQSGNMAYLADLSRTGPRAPDLSVVHDGREDGSQALVKFGPGDLVYAITSRAGEGARVCVVDPHARPQPHWTTVIDPRAGQVLSGCVMLADPASQGPVRFLVSLTEDGRGRLSLHDEAGAPLGEVPLPAAGPGTITRLTTVPGREDRAYFLYTDFLTPHTVFQYTLTDGRLSPYDSTAGEAAPVPGDDTDPWGGNSPTVHQVAYTTDQGIEVPMHLILPPGHEHGPRPTMLTAYGGFGGSASPGYSPTITAWVRAGGIYAIAGVRGGGEKGAAWHAAGRGMNKPNTFTDFDAAARWLCTQGLTTPAQLAIRGASHSGLVVATAITRNPHQYAAAVCSDALTDMIRYPHLGIGTWWTDEFGNPDNPRHLPTLLSYSPYHNTNPNTSYPAVLLTSPRHDPRVGAAHTRKLTAALQHATTSHPVLLRTEHDTGHGPRAATRLIDRQADALAFCATHTHLTPPNTDPPHTDHPA
ncbi:prolyl oligopeptidase family serine peptidase [Streptomyces sp. NPDC048191]|uniref:prolyl oligopeptidase family serine peptidase n=1 Tax=Streptomyces sp. NPDC048191 TaxID=3155484 RepID=UPI0033DAF77E